MSSRSTFMLFAAGWILVAAVTLPAQASAAAPQDGVTPGTAVIGTFPMFDNQIAVRQAHIAWLATREDTGMQATMRYLASVNGSTGKLASLNRDFRIYENTIRNAGSGDRISSGLSALCSTTEAFRIEADARMKSSGGRPAELASAVQLAIAENAGISSLEDQYWEIRSSTGLADLDLWIQRAGRTLGQLQENGYEVTAAQEKLTEITTMRSQLANAFRARDDDGIEQVRETIHAASIDYATTVRMMKKNSSESEEMALLINQSEGVLVRSGMMNANLKSLGINCTQMQALVENGQYQIGTAQAQLNSGNPAGADATLTGFRSTLQSLRDGYRGILVREDLPPTTAQGVLSVAQSLDLMSARMMGV
jgi:hypothetical protein